MAKQGGPHFFTGTLGDLVFYKQGDQYYVRKKSTYNKKKLQKPGAYPLMQLKQGEFGQASRLASKVYRTLPRQQKKQGLFGQFTKTARQFLKEGKTPEEVVASLRSLYLVEKETVAIQGVESRHVSTSSNVKAIKLFKVTPKEQADINISPRPILKESATTKGVSIAYTPQHRRSVSLPGFTKQVRSGRKNRKLKWLTKTDVQLK